MFKCTSFDFVFFFDFFFVLIYYIYFEYLRIVFIPMHPVFDHDSDSNAFVNITLIAFSRTFFILDNVIKKINC